jgi:hypothetical protein
MKWFSINDDPLQKTFELKHNREKLLTLWYHPATATIRLTAENEKRVFLVRRRGFRRNRIVLLNEYGVQIGQLSHDSSQEDMGTIKISGLPFQYMIQKNLPALAAIYKGGETVVVCEMPETPKEFQSVNNDDLLVLILCWYTAAAVKKEQKEYA